MTFFERCRSFTVKVSGGSGVIFQPMTDKYSYILTAKHNLYNDPDTMKEAKEIIIKACDIEIDFKQKDRYEHNTLDIAILKIDKVDIDTPFKEFEVLSKDLNYEFCGYPNYRRDETDKIKQQMENYEVNYSKQDGTLVTFDNPKFAKVEEIIGASGGGVFREKDGKIYLVAIEYEMNAKEKSKATHERIDFRAIEAFDEIIEQYSKELEPLFPPYLNDFSLLLDDIFILKGLGKIEKKLIQDRLRYIAKSLSNNIKPIDIKKKYTLLESYYDIKYYSNKELWSMYLEFMVISVFVDLCSPLNVEAIEDIHKKRKFLYIKTNDWIEKTEEILTSDFTSLAKNGTVIVCSEGNREPTSCMFNTKALTHIADGIMSEEFNIDYGISSPAKDFKFKHIHAVQKQIIDDYTNGDSIFDRISAKNVEEVIKNEIYKIFN